MLTARSTNSVLGFADLGAASSACRTPVSLVTGIEITCSTAISEVPSPVSMCSALVSVWPQNNSLDVGVVAAWLTVVHRHEQRENAHDGSGRGQKHSAELMTLSNDQLVTCRQAKLIERQSARDRQARL